jgi:hypothetical protein
MGGQLHSGAGNERQTRFRGPASRSTNPCVSSRESGGHHGGMAGIMVGMAGMMVIVET